MTIRVAVAGTGNAGRLALRHVLTDSRFELVAVWVHSPERVGRDAGELAGLRPTPGGATPGGAAPGGEGTSGDAAPDDSLVTGIVATGDWGAVLAAAPDVLVYCAMADHRLREALADLRPFLTAGVDVVATAPTPLVFPWGSVAAKHLDPLEAAAVAGGASLFVSGVDPGFANDLIPLALAGTCRSVEQVRCAEIADYASYDGSIVMFDVMGFGAPPEETPLLLLPGVLSRAWGPTIRLLATGLGIEIDEIAEWYEQEPAPEAFDVAAGRIPKGGMAGLRFEIRGMRGSEAKIVIEHVTRLRDDLRPDWLRPARPGGSYRVEITGEPSYTVDICPTSQDGDHNHAAILAGVGRVVNAIPAVIAAPPGIRTTLDLPLVLRGENHHGTR